MAGNIYDKLRKTSSTYQGIPNQQKQYQEISNQENSTYIFALSFNITLTAKLAKADGVVTQDEIEVFKDQNSKFHLMNKSIGS